MPTEKELSQIKQLLDTAEDNIRSARALIFSRELAAKSEKIGISEESEEANVIEGIFDGEKMVGSNLKHYFVPANYASKSKLVSGDTLKLTVFEDGSFVFKQIGPVKRKKLIGDLIDLGDNKFVIKSGNVKYRVLPASITYFKVKNGDKLSILVPEEATSEWAAVENVL